METAEWHRYVNTSNILKYSRMADAMTGTKGIYEKARRDLKMVRLSSKQ